jgi:hypothetical protein
MIKRAGIFAAVLVVLGCTGSQAIRLEALEPVVIGGRFQYLTSLDHRSVPFPWNTTAQSSEDLTRLMLDLTADTRYGDLYLKGSAVWNRTRPSQIQKRFLFEQGDYLWAQHLNKLDYSLRLFANERRFITYDMIAPLLSDDLVAGQDNLGLRFDSQMKGGIGVTGLYSALGEGDVELRDITYLRTAYFGKWTNASASYLLDHPGGAVPTNHAVFKVEASASYKQGYAILSYQQSGFSNTSVFFPDGSFDWGSGSVRGLLPEGGALFAEARLTSIRIPKQGQLKLVYNYAMIGDQFFNDLGLARDAQESNRFAAYFVAWDVDVNARLEYGSSKRTFFEDKDIQRWEASIWGRLANGMDYWLRGGATDTKTPDFDDEGNFAHAALYHQVKKVRSGVHAMWKDTDTIFSDKRFAWDGKLALSPNWGWYWRLILSNQFDVGEMLYTRLAYRPNNRIFVTFSYGRRVIGDGPFVLEDQDIELSRFSTAQYSLFLRGDF